MSLFGFLRKKPSVIITTNNLKLEKMLESKIPSESVSYVMTLWKSHPFNFTISRARKTCLGNYRFKNQQHFISVNGDSNPFSFLITLIHEIAHQHVTLNHRIFRKKPKTYFKIKTWWTLTKSKWCFHFFFLFLKINNLL